LGCYDRWQISHNSNSAKQLLKQQTALAGYQVVPKSLRFCKAAVRRLDFQDFIAVSILSFRQKKMLRTSSLYCYVVVHLFPSKGESEIKVHTSK
jgi:hypothetical protein